MQTGSALTAWRRPISSMPPQACSGGKRGRCVDKPPIMDVLRAYGYDGREPSRSTWSKIKCPFHDDRSASASVNQETNQFRCFACMITSPLGNGGSTHDSFDLIAWKEGCDDFPSTKLAAESILGERYGDVLSGAQGKSSRRVFGERTRPKRGQRNAFSSRVRRRAFTRS